MVQRELAALPTAFSPVPTAGQAASALDLGRNEEGGRHLFFLGRLPQYATYNYNTQHRSAPRSKGARVANRNHASVPLSRRSLHTFMVGRAEEKGEGDST